MPQHNRVILYTLSSYKPRQLQQHLQNFVVVANEMYPERDIMRTDPELFDFEYIAEQIMKRSEANINPSRSPAKRHAVPSCHVHPDVREQGPQAATSIDPRSASLEQSTFQPARRLHLPGQGGLQSAGRIFGAEELGMLDSI